MHLTHLPHPKGTRTPTVCSFPSVAYTGKTLSLATSCMGASVLKSQLLHHPKFWGFLCGVNHLRGRGWWRRWTWWNKGILKQQSWFFSGCYLVCVVVIFLPGKAWITPSMTSHRCDHVKWFTAIVLVCMVPEALLWTTLHRGLCPFFFR